MFTVPFVTALAKVGLAVALEQIRKPNQTPNTHQNSGEVEAGALAAARCGGGWHPIERRPEALAHKAGPSKRGSTRTSEAGLRQPRSIFPVPSKAGSAPSIHYFPTPLLRLA